jgi:hypothetical protein
MVGHNDHSKNYMAGEQKKDKKGGMGGMLAAGIGGAGLGALAGHALSDNSDDGTSKPELRMIRLTRMQNTMAAQHPTTQLQLLVVMATEHRLLLVNQESLRSNIIRSCLPVNALRSMKLVRM